MLCWGISRRYMLGASVYQGGICWGISKRYMLGYIKKVYAGGISRRYMLGYIKVVYAGVYQGGICYMLGYIKEVYAGLYQGGICCGIWMRYMLGYMDEVYAWAVYQGGIYSICEGWRGSRGTSHITDPLSGFLIPAGDGSHCVITASTATCG